MYKKTGNPEIEELTKSETDRQYSLSCVKAPVKEGKRYCTWCNEKPLAGGNQKYCSTECSTNMMAWGYPQKEEGLGLLLIRQAYKCNACQYDWVPYVEQVINREGMYSPVPKDFDYLNKTNFVLIKRLKYKVPNDRCPEVDHIIPISKGGQSLGLENHQAICYTCHKAKTKIDNSGKRTKKIDKIGK